MCSKVKVQQKASWREDKETTDQIDHLAAV